MESSDSDVVLLSLSATSTEFNFDSGCSTPYISAPSSPARIPNFFNSDAPIVNPFHCQFSQLMSFKEADMKQCMGKETERSGVSGEEDNFIFDFGGKSDGFETVFAEELFDGGKIRPLKTELKVKPSINSNRNPKMPVEHPSSFSPQSSKFIHSCGNKDGGPRPEKTTSCSMLLVHKTVSLWDMFPFSKQHRKWKLKNLLFRSASEGRNDVVSRSSSTTGSNRRTNETVDVVYIRNDAVRASSFRSNESSSNSGSTRRRRRARSISAHELHYTLNRAASEESKKRTYLPYKQSLLGCFGLGQSTDVVSRIGLLTRG